jgi:hypothetical protein
MSRDLCTCRRGHGPDLAGATAGAGRRGGGPRPAAAGEAAGQLAAVVAAGAAGAYAWALDGPDAARRVWREQARLGLALLERRLERPGADGDRFALGSQVSTVAQWAWLGDRLDAGRRADLVAAGLAIGGWPGHERAARSTSRPSPPSATSSATWSAPTTTWPS